MTQKLLSGRCQRRATFDSNEQRASELLLQEPDPRAHGRLRDIESFRGRMKLPVDTISRKVRASSMSMHHLAKNLLSSGSYIRLPDLFTNHTLRFGSLQVLVQKEEAVRAGLQERRRSRSVHPSNASMEVAGRASGQDKSNARREYIVYRQGTASHDPG